VQNARRRQLLLRRAFSFSKPAELKEQKLERMCVLCGSSLRRMSSARENCALKQRERVSYNISPVTLGAVSECNHMPVLMGALFHFCRRQTHTHTSLPRSGEWVWLRAAHPCVPCNLQRLAEMSWPRIKLTRRLALLSFPPTSCHADGLMAAANPAVDDSNFYELSLHSILIGFFCSSSKGKALRWCLWQVSKLALVEGKN
jgi:hypothetical protein